METGEIANKPKNTFSRRGFLALAIGATGTALLAGAKAAGLIGSAPSPQSNKEEKNQPVPPLQFPKTRPVATPTTIAPVGLPLAKMEPVEPNQEPKISAIEAIIPIPIGDPVRPKAEVEYAKHALTIKDIDIGLMFLVDKIARRRLLDKRFEIRQNEKQANLTVLTQERIDWAEKNGILPEALGICLDAYPKARRIIEILKSDLRDDLRNNPQALIKIKPDDIMINPGGMAALVRVETDSFIDIGHVPAIKQINTRSSDYSNENKLLKILCGKLSRDTGLLFDPENVPGSERGNAQENISGGAIGMQFMPGTALAIYELFEKYNLSRDLENDPELKFNPFNPESSVIGAWVFLARHERFTQGERFGYLRGDDEKMMFALRKWNNVPAVAKSTLSNAKDYWDKFIAAKT